MFARFLRKAGSLIGFKPKSHDKPRRVAVVGSAGKMGSLISLLLKQSPYIEMLIMCDISTSNCGIAMDVSHVDTPCRVRAFTGKSQFVEALKDCDVVLVCAGKPRNTALMSQDDLFKTNAPIIQHVTECFARSCPKAFLGIITQPINSLVPLASEVLKQHGVHDPRRVFGLSCVDVMRATKFASETGKGAPAPEDMIVPVIGGHCEKTIVPVFSQAKPCEAQRLDDKQTKQARNLTVRSAGWVITMKDEIGTAMLTPSYAVARFTNNLIRALNGVPKVNECAFVSTDVVPDLKYCALPVQLTTEGVNQVQVPDLTEDECNHFTNAKCDLRLQIKTGENYVLNDRLRCAKPETLEIPRMT